MVRWLALLTLVCFGGGGWALVDLVQERSTIALLIGSRSIGFQVVAGSAVGLLIAMVAAWLIDRPFMVDIKQRYTDLIGPWFRHPAEVWLVSLCAGIGEELFFRGAVQYWLGIVPTAVLFVAVHGYLDPRSWRMSTYGVVLTMAMCGLGWMAAHWGLVAPMAAHAVIDVVLLGKLKRANGTPHSVG